MQVNINHEKSIDGFAERIISMDLEEYKESEDERIKKFIPKTEDKIERLKRLIEIMQ